MARELNEQTMGHFRAEVEIESDDDDWRVADRAGKCTPKKVQAKSVVPMQADPGCMRLTGGFSVAVVIATKTVYLHETSANKPYLLVISPELMSSRNTEAADFLDERTAAINAMRRLDRMLKDRGRLDAFSAMAATDKDAAALLAKIINIPAVQSGRKEED